jgi:hypothetical protein
MSIPFIEMPEPAVPRGARRLARVPLDHDRPGHHVLGQAGARVPVHAHGGALVHPRAVVADVPFDLDLDLGIEPAGDRVRAVRVEDAPVTRPRRRGQVVQALVELAQRRRGEVDDLDGCRLGGLCRFHQSPSWGDRSPTGR